MSDGEAEANEYTERWLIWATETVRLVEPPPAWASLAEHFIGEIQNLIGHVLEQRGTPHRLHRHPRTTSQASQSPQAGIRSEVTTSA
ncbi:MAG: hypothetical protein QOI89_3672 [Solirubrobacteraceae bacterium]|nr:hypothetical protein [Solirubrobacteraceae bacterium]